MASLAAVKSKFQNRPKLGLFIIVAVLAIVAGGLFYANQHKSYSAAQALDLANQASFNGNQAQALKYAKQALAKDPNNLDNIELVAKLTKIQDPTAAKAYYNQEYQLFLQQANPDKPGQPVGIYWAAAELAREAGQTAQAKKYYQQVIQLADPSNSYEQKLVEQAQAQLAGLK